MHLDPEAGATRSVRAGNCGGVQAEIARRTPRIDTFILGRREIPVGCLAVLILYFRNMLPLLSGFTVGPALVGFPAAPIDVHWQSSTNSDEHVRKTTNHWQNHFWGAFARTVGMYDLQVPVPVSTSNSAGKHLPESIIREFARHSFV
jgi:hypothetical protein